MGRNERGIGRVLGDGAYKFDTRYPSVSDLREATRKRIPKFAFDYLEGGCNEEVNLRLNESDLARIRLKPNYLKDFDGADLGTELFGHRYDAPFGIAPIGLQGLMWPNAPEILARAALRHNIPYVLSTVSTGSIERIGEVSEGRAWFQLYHPTEDRLRDDILRRLKSSGYGVLIVLVDVPAFGFRHREIKSGLSMPPKLNTSNIWQAVCRPRWGLETLRSGIPGFATLKPYMDKGLSMSQLGRFMDATFTGRVDAAKVRTIRDRWDGKLVLKGVASERDAEFAAAIGVDGVIVSNHGGRQLDAAESSVKSLERIHAGFSDKFRIMVDGGIRSGPDIARVMAMGADFAFMGRPFMYGVGALGRKGGDHTIGMFKAQLKQVMEQLGCESVGNLTESLAV
ncbi:alpha-hydroxy acid oxidase [Parapedobacter soli]|uniref:alpha-hydroxy acid oxidase n=1 Tax=Parapedobacter soli TaxID=416955 RepID=UPI0021C9FD03|nr:alpha-hydroxy acid oxidase [Parapedobacter soli]